MYAIPLGYTVEVGQWYKLGTTMLGNGSSNTLQVSVNDVLWIDQTDSELSYEGLAFLSYGYEEPFEIAYDNFRVRQYASQEPLVAFGAEEWAEPIVATEEATDITTDSAVLNGNLISLGAVTSVDVSFEWGLDESYGNETAAQTRTENGTFSIPLSGLDHSTTYHFRAKAVGDSTVYGDDMEFTTKTPPIVSTLAATDIAVNTATLNGNLTSLGSASSVQVSFEWGLTDSYGNETMPESMSGNGTFFAGLSGLSPGTFYHFRAKAVGDSTVYGDDMIFQSKAPPSVTTLAASAVTINSATLNGNLSDLGTASTVYVSFEWGLDTSYGNATSEEPKSGTGTFNAGLGSLESGVTYHFRAKAVGDVTVYGDDMTFTTNNIKGVTGEVNCSILPEATVSIYSGAVLIDSTVSDVNGYYELKAVDIGTYQVTVSKAGYRDVTRPLTVTGPGLYTLNFKGESGLVPNAPNMSYVLLCVNHWLYPPPDCGLSMSRVLQIVNAWLYPIL